MKKNRWVQSMFSPVLHDDAEKARVANLARRIVLALQAGSLAIAVVAFAFSNSRTFSLAALSLVFFVFTYVLLRFTYVRIASILTVSYILVLALYSISTGDGIHDVAIILFPAYLLIASLLLSKGVFVLYSVLAVLAIALTGTGEVLGVIENRYSPHANWTDVALATVLMAVTAFLIRVLIENLLNVLAQSRKSEENYREIFNAVNEAVFIHDATNGRILDVNDSMLAMYGYDRENVFEASPEDLCTTESPYTAKDALAWIKKTVNEGPQLFLWRAKRKSGDLFWAEVNLSSTTIGGEGRILAVVRDVTDKKLIEEELRQSEKMRAIGQLAGGVAHDFNNQLGGIMGFAEVLRMDAKDPELIECTDGIIKSAERAAALTKQLLTFARKGATKHQLVDMNAVVDETIAMLERIVDRRVNIISQKTTGDLKVIGDLGQLQNALLNLAINARDAMPEGGEVRFETDLTLLDEEYCAVHTHRVNPGYHVKVSVTDTGTGIDASLRERIFEPFFTTKKESEGTGMGLAAVFGTIKAHAGSVEVYSELGHGSTFTLYIPSASAGDEPDQVEAEGAPAGRAQGTIMVVDDEEILRTVAVRILEARGYRAIPFPNGNEAVAYYQDHHNEIDLILLDLIMPEMSGHEVCLRVKALNPEARIVIASGYNASNDIQSLLGKGVGAYIQKPYKRHELLAAVGEILGD